MMCIMVLSPTQSRMMNGGVSKMAWVNAISNAITSVGAMANIVKGTVWVTVSGTSCHSSAD